MDETKLNNANLDNIVLALLFASDEPLSARKIASIIEDAPIADVKAAVENLRQRIDEEKWSVTIEQVAGGYRFSSRSEYAPYIARMYSGKRRFRLSRAGLEALAIVAYKQPITRAEIETIRGVGSGGVIANLMERSLVKIVGKAKVLGAPFLYGSTAEFLEYLGLNSIKDLPSLEELETLLQREAEEANEGEVSVVPQLEDDEIGDGDDETIAPELPVAAAAKVAASLEMRQEINDERESHDAEGEDVAAEVVDKNKE